MPLRYQGRLVLVGLPTARLVPFLLDTGKLSLIIGGVLAGLGVSKLG